MTETFAGLACAEFGDDAQSRELTAAGLRLAVPSIAYSPWLPAITATYALGAPAGEEPLPGSAITTMQTGRTGMGR
jgi:hypothetical protein